MNGARARTWSALAGLAGVAALVPSGPAFADSGAAVGYGGAGNQINPLGQILDLPRDPEGPSQLDEITRTPTGLLYPVPYALPLLTQNATDPDWWSMGWIRLGGIFTFGAGKNSASLNRYGDLSGGLLLGSAGFLIENHRTADYFSGLAENAGRDDQYYELRAGRYGEFAVTAFFDSLPHVYSTEARSIWTGSGTDNLALRPGLTPGASTPAQVSAVAQAAVPTKLSITRQEAGLSLTYTPWDSLEIFMQLSNEWRNGTQPIGATFGYPFEMGATQIIQPIHYRTLDVATAVRYKDEDGDLMANLTFTGSYFNNDMNSLTWQNPGLELVSPGSFIPKEGLLSLPPSNHFNSLKGDMTAILAPDMRFSASLSYGLMRQDDALLPPTIGSGVIPGASGPIDLANWNTTAALSQLHAHAAIDVFDAFAQFQYSISPALKLDFELRDHDEMNRTNYVAFNPLTGQYGYIAIDGGLAPYAPLSGVYQPSAPGSIVQIRDMPFANDNLELTARADYRLSNHLKLQASYVRNSIEHSVREVPNAADDRFRLQLDANGYSWGTIRISYEFGKLSGSDYTSNPYTPYYSTSLPGYVPATPTGDAAFTLDNLRKFDVGDRTEHIVHAQGNYIVSTQTDLQLTSDYKVDFYNAQYGLRASSSFDANADVNYQMSPSTVFTAFFTFQTLHRNIANINSTGVPGSGAAGGVSHPFANAWSEQLGSNDVTAGLTVNQRWDEISVDANYVYMHGDSAIGYSYASTGAFFSLLTAAQAGSAFPDIVFDAHSLQVNARWQASPMLSYQLLYRLDFQHLDDFHYDDLSPVIASNTYLGVVPENFTAQTIGLALQYTF
ncbi:MAG TPA: MtrB/PioB family outer membrane beta-barrel protein [Rhizomicrobium sp.]